MSDETEFDPSKVDTMLTVENFLPEAWRIYKESNPSLFNKLTPNVEFVFKTAFHSCAAALISIILYKFEDARPSEIRYVLQHLTRQLAEYRAEVAAAEQVAEAARAAREAVAPQPEATP